ncbi:MAG: hypothetical protein Pars2KO_28120 [Parasphingorhabdus sp.]
MIKKGYSDGPFGQIHWRIMEAQNAATKSDLYCMHPGPFSGIAYTNIMPHLALNRRVIAPDYPGYGGSDPFKEHPSIEEYAHAIFAVVKDLSGDTPIDLTGFHTGNLVAGEMAVTDPSSINRLAFVDVPAFDAETSAKYRSMAAQPFEISDDKECLAKPWKRGVTSRLSEQGSARAIEMFAEQLRAGRNMHAAFDAAFTYDVYDRLPQITHACLVLGTQSDLLDATRWAGANIPNATFVERLDIEKGVLDQNAEATAKEILTFLDGAD